MRKKKIIFLIISFFLATFVVEIFGHLFYRLNKGVFLWQISKNNIFNIRPFTELVNDERFVTNKKDFYYVYNNAWKVETDSNRFRVGNNRYFKNKDNFVFLGDSVPFGWGINGEQSVPSQFYSLVNSKFPFQYGVINAAIPSYSLYQAIKRYEYELHGKFPVKYIILQIYDPVAQFLIWGRKWNKQMCWTSKDSMIVARDITKQRKPRLFFLHKYSSIYHAINVLNKKLKRKQEQASLLDINDTEAFSFFEQENFSVLENFYNLLKEEEITLIILPVNPTHGISIEKTKITSNSGAQEEKEAMVIAELNRILEKFASLHKNVYFFDLVPYFDKIGREGLFIDDCCHLSEKGAQQEAEFVFEHLQINGLL